jgi:D-glycero-alpha-D-manno-heptose 1-phosphate guanylyltransferase
LISSKNNNINEMLILAGGLGTRLQSHVSNVPKPMAPILGRPFLALFLEYWISQGIEKFVISIGYKASVIKNYFSDSFMGAEIIYSEEDSPLGTGGAIKKSLESNFFSNELIMIANGDTWLDINSNNFFMDFKKQSLPGSICLFHIDENDRYGSVFINGNGSIQKFDSINRGGHLINGGCYIFERIFLTQYLVNYPDIFSFEADVLEKLSSERLLGSSIYKSDFLDIGIPEDYLKAELLIKKYFASREIK